MKIVFAGGGTAGHINPALALASYVQKENPDAKILFLGTKQGMEKELVPKSGFNIRFINAQGIKRKISLKNINALFKSFCGLLEAIRILKAEAPDAVVGTGGYVSGPVLMAASLLGIKTLIHEQNAIPGATTKILSKRADKIAISFKESEKYFERKEALTLTGNPLRLELFHNNYADCRKALSVNNEFLIVCVAGSLGAEKISKTMEELIPMLLPVKEIRLVFATGKRYYNDVKESLLNKGIDIDKEKQIRVCEYLYDAGIAYSAADLMITRAGAITVSELAALSKAAIIVPSPNVTNNHQLHNAKILSDAGAAILIEEKDLSAKSLFDEITKLLNNRALLLDMEKKAGEKGLKKATETLYNELMALIRA